MTANTHTELAVATVDRIKQLKAERKRYFDVEGDGVDEVLSECWSTIESLSLKLEAAREALRETKRLDVFRLARLAALAANNAAKVVEINEAGNRVSTILSEGDADVFRS
jgi:hypothetical protein